ncbi:colony stimulating factor 3 (granulocyte) b [Chanodichthys erythropterus]|uniref:colony stimulating factor 3 (granulocyte) b n=1 Tax=Chanodichthys erythropterus TaxID=933992 RepID=UPI00351EFA29
MKFYLTLAVHCCLALVYSAPLRDPKMTHAVESAMSLAQKILRDIPGAHEACVKTTGLTLSSEAKDLEYLLNDIGIPAPPVLKSEELTMEMSLSRIVEGLELHHKLLQEIGSVLSSTEELNLLLADVTDLSAQLHEMQRLAQIPSTESKKAFTLQLNGDYQVRVAAHLSLKQLRSFTQDVFRSLRHIALSN